MFRASERYRPHFVDHVGTMRHYNMVGEWASDPAMRQRILVDNAARLLGF
jgi:hypothetical protein